MGLNLKSKEMTPINDPGDIGPPSSATAPVEMSTTSGDNFGVGDGELDAGEVLEVVADRFLDLGFRALDKWPPFSLHFLFPLK